ncbi:hypothetical protein AB0N09_35510 [Streptomyces erythrochromogenes]|uniref:hypothetical protein n=1 Tax=Streptomyces erythrochromogenes TaxID=285574 RepID=UPI00343B3F49
MLVSQPALTQGMMMEQQFHPDVAEAWAVLAPVLQEADADLQATVYQALTTPDSLPLELWQHFMGLLSLEDLTRLAETSQGIRKLVEGFVPEALDPAANTAAGFVRTLYAQTALDAVLNDSAELHFIPGAGSDLTISHGFGSLHGPGTLTGVTGGIVHANVDVTITDVADGTVHARDRATITNVSGGTVGSNDYVTIMNVTGGTVCADDHVTIMNVTGGTVYANDHVTIMNVTGGTVYAHDNAQITAEGGTIIIRSPHITIIGNGATIVREP